MTIELFPEPTPEEREEREEREFIAGLKARGVSHEEAGYLCTSRLYAKDSSAEARHLLREVCESIIKVRPDDGFVIGSLRWLDEADSLDDPQ